MKRSSELVMLAVTAAFTCSTAMAVWRWSNGTGGGLFNDTATWSGGVVPSQTLDQWTVNAGDAVTIPNDYSWVRNQNNSNEGAFVVEPRGHLFMNRILGLVSGWTIYSAGTVSVGRIATGVAGKTTVAGGLFTVRDNIMALDASLLITDGRLQNGGAMGPMVISNGVMDCKNMVASFNGGLTWVGGTIANLRHTSNTERGKINTQFKGGCTYDLNDQTWSHSVATDDFGAMGLTFMNGGTVQFDVYSSTNNDCDFFLTTSLGNSVASNVLFLIGDGGGLPGVRADYTGATYQIVRAGGYNNITPAVGTSEWYFAGENQTWAVIFDNNLGVDGTVTAWPIPEPFAAALAVAAAALFSMRRK
ncbi:hypothetical protein GX586_13685 [bacterium]|nr:hypothetical protein [bacterium]